jgi:hypothetical protein
MTVVSVYRGHKWMPSESPAAAVLTTHNLSIENVFSSLIDVSISVISSEIHPRLDWVG